MHKCPHIFWKPWSGSICKPVTLIRFSSLDCFEWTVWTRTERWLLVSRTQVVDQVMKRRGKFCLCRVRSLNYPEQRWVVSSCETEDMSVDTVSAKMCSSSSTKTPSPEEINPLFKQSTVLTLWFLLLVRCESRSWTVGPGRSRRCHWKPWIWKSYKVF